MIPYSELLWSSDSVCFLLTNPRPPRHTVSGLLRSAVGKTSLLINKKFAQFRGLCQQNLEWEASQRAAAMAGGNQRDVSDSGTQLVTLSSDLDGFWAMVTLQVDNVREMFERIEELRSGGWKSLPPSAGGDENAEPPPPSTTPIVSNGTSSGGNRHTTSTMKVCQLCLCTNCWCENI